MFDQKIPGLVGCETKITLTNEINPRQSCSTSAAHSDYSVPVVPSYRTAFDSRVELRIIS